MMTPSELQLMYAYEGVSKKSMSVPRRVRDDVQEHLESAYKAAQHFTADRGLSSDALSGHFTNFEFNLHKARLWMSAATYDGPGCSAGGEWYDGLAKFRLVVEGLYTLSRDAAKRSEQERYDADPDAHWTQKSPRRTGWNRVPLAEINETRYEEYASQGFDTEGHL